jgi:hypothetical protein
VITGHLGVAAVIRRGWPGASLFWLLPASLAPDLLDVAFAFAGFCNPYGLYSHTIPAAALQAAVLGGAALLITGSRTTALATATVVLAHLPADVITGYKLFWPGGPLMGLDLYARPLLDFLLEVPIALGGWWLLRRTPPPGAPRWATSALAAVALVLIQGVLDSAVIKGLDKPSACETTPLTMLM